MSMTPPIRMVSVPVEPTEAMMLAADAVDWNNEDERGAVINMWQAMLTAAPVREEGGAVLANDLRCLKETFERIAARPPEDQPHYKSGVRPFGTGDLRHIIEVLTKAAALATREEAPAEAAPACLEIPLSNHMRVTLEYDPDGSRTATLWNEANEPIADGDAPNLRAQPPAREDAQPVAWLVTNRATGHEELFWKPLADLPFNRERFSTAPLYTHPAPDALRVAVDAVRWIDANAARSDCFEVSFRARQALAALQAEQKGGA